MDKYEYKVRAEEIKSLIAEGEFAEAVKIADTIDWRRVKSVMMLCTISDLYKINRRFQESKDILLMAYERHPGGRLIVYSLCELSIKMGEFVQAIEYYKEFVQIAPKDTGRYILQYKLYEAQDVSLEERIAVLEEFKKRDYREKWAYELAYLYHRVGLETKCVEECDELVVWFGEGRYVQKALELKTLHQPLTPAQEEKYRLLKAKSEQQILSAREEQEQEQNEDRYSGEPSGQDDETEETYESADDDRPQDGYSSETGETAAYVRAGGNRKISEFPGYNPAYRQPEEDEEEFRVKTVDVGQYNTINLQRELAESMKEFLGDETGENRHDEKSSPVGENRSDEKSSSVGGNWPDEKNDHTGNVEPAEADESEASTMGPITRSIIAPLLQETEDMSQIKDMPQIKDAGFVPFDTGKGQEPVPMKHAEAATEEVFFEDVKDVLLEDTKEINLGEAQEGNPGDTKELNPKRRVIYPSAPQAPYAPQTPYTASQTPYVPQAPHDAQAQHNPRASHIAQMTQMPQTLHAPGLMKPAETTGFEQMLSQEYDGQISLAVQEKEGIEKQITGQMNISDIMAEWERMKRENEEKRREDVRKRVQQQTGNLFSEFDEATKSGLLEHLTDLAQDAEKAEENTAPEQTEERAEQTPSAEERAEQAPESAATVPEQTPSAATAPEQTQAAAAAAERTQAAAVGSATVLAATAAAQVSEAAAENGTQARTDTKEWDEAQSVPALTDTGILDLEKILLSEEQSKKEAAKEEAQESSKLRPLSEEEKELFGKYIHGRKAKEQLLQAIDTISMDSYSGNAIVTGEEEAAPLEVAKGLVRMLQMSEGNFSGKVAKISGSILNKKTVEDILSKLSDGALIIEHATAMSSSTAADLNRALAKENNGIFVVMEGKKDEMNIFLHKNAALMDNFNARVDIEALNDQALVEYARQYAEEMEYSIDELGILALHTRIADMQTSDHEVTVSEVQDLVDDAIYFADKKNPKHFFDLLFGKRYDEEDMIILREKDFMHY